MRILSIESSCDETSAAVVELVDNQVIVHSNITATSLLTHAKTGGIIPENAAREQVKYIIPVIIQALLRSCHSEAQTKNPKDEILHYIQDDKEKNSRKARTILEKDIDAIAVTYGPGLIGSLLVGVETAKTLSYVFNKPLIPVNHLLAHIFANFITTTNDSQPTTNKAQVSSQKLEVISYPFIGLIVSGAHTDLLYFKSVTDYKWLGGTRDDAAGECFDKCARLLGFDYPGGPKISTLAKKGNAKNIKLPKLMTDDNFDFSFSGLKTAFMNIVRLEFEISKTPTKDGYSWIHANINNLPSDKQQLLYDLCAALEETIIEVLIRKTLKAAEKYDCKTILLGGGVSANQTLIEKLKLEARSQLPEAHIFAPEKKYCTDNGAMVGAYALLNPAMVNWSKVSANPNLYFD